MRNISLKNSWQRLLLVVLLLFELSIATAQTVECDPYVSPVLFGLSRTYVYCKNVSVGFGVSNSKSGQVYNFSVYKRGVERLYAGPLDGNGGQLSISASMRSSQEVGEYRITSSNDCGNTGFSSFYVFYSEIENLSISAWGNNSVSFNWAPCGPGNLVPPLDVVTYEYAVTTQSDPNSPLITYLTTTDTTATVAALTAGLTYYIHIRVLDATLNGVAVETNFNCPGGDYPWETIRFISCAGVAPTSFISPANAVLCTGGSAILAASTANSYQWYKDDNSIIAGAVSSTYTASVIGGFRVYVTTLAGCAGMVSTATVTQTSLLTGVFSGGGCFQIDDSVKLAISKTIVGQSYKILRDGIEVASLEGIGRASESQDTIWYNFKFTDPAQSGTYTVRMSNPYCNAVDFGNVTVSTNGSWIGSVNSNWEDPLNWSCGHVPDANTAVVIKNTAANFPQINSDAFCKSIDIATGATITIKTGKNLFVSGP